MGRFSYTNKDKSNLSGNSLLGGKNRKMLKIYGKHHYKKLTYGGPMLMDRRLYLKLICIIPVIIMLSLTFSPGTISGQTGSLHKSEEKIEQITDQQKEILQKLFAQEQRLAAMAREEKGVAGDIEDLNKQTAALQKSIVEEETIYAGKKEELKQLLQSYQKMGPGSYLEIILESNDLTDFLRRINLLRELSGNSGKLIGQLQGNLEKQTADKTKLAAELASLNSRQAEYQASLVKERQLKQDLEEYLASLATEKGNYQLYLAYLKNNWADLKPTFAKAVKGLAGFMNKDLPADGFKVTYSFFEIKASITDEAINNIITGDSAFPPMSFRFRPGNVEIQMPEYNLVLDGTFVIQEGSSFIFQAKAGSFYGIPLETGSLNELFQDGDLVINLQPALGNYTVNSLAVMDGYLELTLSP
jgi:peptidoglycan hydrolase CwlO-like protein